MKSRGCSRVAGAGLEWEGWGVGALSVESARKIDGGGSGRGFFFGDGARYDHCLSAALLGSSEGGA